MVELVATLRRPRGGPRALRCWPAALLVLLAACGGRAPESHETRVERHRETKDAFLARAADSPILPEDREQFLPLGYFPVDDSYNVAAVLAPSEREPAIEMPTSTGLRRQMRRAGTLRFSLKGEPMSLTAFVEANDTAFARLFVPFADLTNGTETYAAGRYLDLDRTATGIYELDFNLAYHPYCYYNELFDCPFPPPENRLRTPVRAGERTRPAR
jgi:uncharacterized protein